MSENQQPKNVQNKASGILNDLTTRVKLIIRLMGDNRISPIIKLLPIGAIIYLIVPDLLPGPFDDALVLWIGTSLFLELCPPDVVQEHMKALNLVVPGQWRDPAEDVVDGEVHEVR